VGTDPFLETPDTNTFELLNYWINVLDVEFRHTKKRGVKLVSVIYLW